MSEDKRIKGLNDALAAELGIIIRYIVQTSKAHGPDGAGVRELRRLVKGI